jgi:hypothetical protein
VTLKTAGHIVRLRETASGFARKLHPVDFTARAKSRLLNAVGVGGRQAFRRLENWLCHFDSAGVLTASPDREWKGRAIKLMAAAAVHLAPSTDDSVIKSHVAAPVSKRLS